MNIPSESPFVQQMVGRSISALAFSMRIVGELAYIIDLCGVLRGSVASV